MRDKLILDASREQLEDESLLGQKQLSPNSKKQSQSSSLEQTPSSSSSPLSSASCSTLVGGDSGSINMHIRRLNGCHRPAGSARSKAGSSGHLGNKCGKCQNHDVERSKKGHARDCPFKKCECLKCRLLDARSDILQVISGKETKLKGTKKDPNCGFCQNHGIKILRKGHVRSCGYGQERHFRLDNCFDCEVHYIRNEVNRLQIKMRRAMKEDRMLSDEQKKTAREAITREEVEKVCDMARLARRKRGVNSQQVAGGEPSMMDAGMRQQALCGVTSPNHPSCSAAIMVKRERHSFDGHNAEAQQVGPVRREFVNNSGPVPVRRHPYHSQPQLQHSMPLPLASPSTPQQQQQQHQSQLKPLSHHQTEAGVWRPWSHQQQQIVAAMAAQQHQHQQQLQHQQHHHQNHQFEAQRHLSQASPQFINQMQLHQSQAQVVDCTMRHQQQQFGSRGNGGSAIDSVASLFDREPHNSSMAHGRMLSMPELHQPVDLKCTLQQSTRVSDPSQSTSSHDGPNSNRFFASHQGNITQAHSMFDSSSQYQQQQQQQHHERPEARITNYDAQSVAGGQPSDEAIDPELDIMSSPDRSYYASNESSVESLTPIRVVTPPADSASININLLVSSPANLGSSNIHGNNHNHHANNNNNNNNNNNGDNNNNNTITQNQIISQITANNLLNLPQDQPLSLMPRQSREMQLFNTLQLFRLMLQFSVQNQNAN